MHFCMHGGEKWAHVQEVLELWTVVHNSLQIWPIFADCIRAKKKKTGRSVKLAVSGDKMDMQIFLHRTYSVPSAKPHNGRQQLHTFLV